MKEPCRSCPEREKDLGGCRCQAYMLTQDPAMADPVCDKSPHHGVILDIVEKAQKRPDTVEARPLVFRNRKESKELARPF
jgi:pyrroloquinoline quinone biosynthesis protein E